MATSSKKKLAEVKGAALALVSMYEEDAGSGFENADANAYAIPFLAILQSGSPQCKKSDGAYIKGAEEGMIFNTVSQEIVDGDTGVMVIPCYYKRTFVKWAPREGAGGGGFRGEVPPSDPEVLANRLCQEGKDKGRLIDSEGNLLVDTRTHYVLVLDDNGAYQPAVVSMSSTQIKKSRNWMSKMNSIKMARPDGSLFTPPMFSHTYKLTTVPESNDQGSWFGWKIETGAPVVDAALYQAAKEFRAAVSSGEVKEQVPQSGNADDVDF
ncbi:hypothetical protein [Immundisolibacter sp.]